MKRTYALLALSICLLPACDRDTCDAFSGRVLSGKIDTFFGPFKPGNWWVYQNQDSTKTDSVYVSAFSDSLIKDEANCTVYGSRRFTLINSQLAEMNDIAVEYGSTPTEISLKMTAQNNEFPSFTSSSDSLIQSMPLSDNPGINIMDSVRLNDTTYFNILAGRKNPNTFYFGKDRALIGWTTVSDTFNLIRFRIL